MNKISERLSEIPNVVDLVEHNFKNKPKLIESLRSYMDYVDTLYKKASEYDSVIEELNTLKIKYEDCLQKNKVLKSENVVYKDEIKKIAVASISLKSRKELGIAKNVLIIDGNKKKAGATAETIEKEFEDLFSI